MITFKLNTLKMCLLILSNFISVFAFSQYNISGTISTESSIPLVGAAIVLQGTTEGVVSNADGFYSFSKLKKGNHTLVVKFVGYKKIIRQVDLQSDMRIDFSLETSNILTEEIFIMASRADAKTPIAYTNVDKTELIKRNLGQDIPILLSTTPSFIVSSDAGSGVGYTGFRVRGSDANRTNITVDGIPLNDSESHGVFLVNMPDFTSSLEDIQIQRGVGTSSAGAGAFGASINMKTQNVSNEAYTELHSSMGSFNTFKNTVKIGTGLKKGFVFDARLSKITSDGFIDRAESNLQSAYFSAAYIGEKTSVKANIIVGKEKTYQAWNGVPKVRLENNEAGMKEYLDNYLYSQEEYDDVINSDSRTYNKYNYKNETDNYWQKHYRLFITHVFNPETKLKVAFHYTQGEGYYEQYKKNDKLKNYGLKPVVLEGVEIKKTDFVRRKWLDNDFYGTVVSLSKKYSFADFTFGAAWNRYDGDHFGEILWAKSLKDSFYGDRFYDNNGLKDDYSAYIKSNVKINEQLNLFVDLQLRGIDYTIAGIDSKQNDISQKHDFRFFNPKMGLNFVINAKSRIFASLAIANREPNRSNYVDAMRLTTPTSERLLDYELSYKYATGKLAFEANAYFMDYKNQLVLTGGVNDVGSALMTNVKDSYRAGLELSSSIKINDSFNWNANVSFSRNKIKDFTSYAEDWDDENNDNFAIYIGNTHIAMSPTLSANSIFSYNKKAFSAQFISQYVGKQYIDNTSSDDRSLDAYCISKLNLSYELKPSFAKSVKFNLLINNVFDHEYESNAWVYRYRTGNENYTMDGYFPQAGINFITGVSIIF